MPSLFLHRISVVRVYLSIAATAPDPTGQDLRQIIISTDAEKHLTKYTNLFTIKKKMGIEEQISTDEGQYDIPTANILFNSEWFKVFPLRLETR